MDVVIETFNQVIAEKPRESITVVILDNARIHRSAKFERARSEWTDLVVFLIFVPPYSPERSAAAAEFD